MHYHPAHSRMVVMAIAGCTQPLATPILALGAYINDFAFDASGSAYVTGALTGPVDFGSGTFDPGPAVGIFIARYTPAHALAWVKTFSTDILDLQGLTPPASSGQSIALDGADNVYVTGVLYWAVDFGGGSLLGDIATSSSDVYTASGNVFVASYAADGTHRWSNVYRSTLGAGINSGSALAIGAQTVYVAGSGVPGLDLGTGTIGNLAESRYLFVAAFDAATGSSTWSKGLPFDADGFGVVYDMALDAQEQVYVGGMWRGSIDFGAGAVSGGRFSTGNGPYLSETGFVASYTSGTGTLRWARAQNDNNYAMTNALAVDDAGNVYAAGTFASAIDFGGGARDSGSDVGQKIFVASYDSIGNYRTDVVSSNLGGGAQAFATGVDVQGDRLSLSAWYTGPIAIAGVTLNSKPFGPDPSSASAEVALISLDAQTARFRHAQHFGSGQRDLSAKLTSNGDSLVFAALPQGTLDVGGSVAEPLGANTSILIQVTE